MEGAMEVFWDDLDSGEVHLRDRWQFTLKSEFFPHSGDSKSQYIQEFYLFIPNSLQINQNTYSKAEFYLDQSNFIRYKTPEFTFKQLLNKSDLRSPLTRVYQLCEEEDNPANRDKLSYELKLLANVVRSLLRMEIKNLVHMIDLKDPIVPGEEIDVAIHQLEKDIRQLHKTYNEVKDRFQEKWKDPIFYRQLHYIDEFMGYAINHYLTGLLESIRLCGRTDLANSDKLLSNLLIEETRLNDLFAAAHAIKHKKIDTAEGESILYRQSLLNKFVLDPLQLTTNRYSAEVQVQHWIGAMSAGVAMLVYFSLYVWLGTKFILNSLPFIFLTVFFYVLKDRMKEWLRLYTVQHISRWFPDFKTKIKSLTKKKIGLLKEVFSFIDPSQLPSEIVQSRNAEFHAVLETYQRPETVLFYKRIVEINNTQSSPESRRYGLNVIFRFNIHKFLRKASDPYEIILNIDQITKKLVALRLPKVYHLNLIIKSTTLIAGLEPKVQLKKFRLVIDKNGIKRIEQIARL
jgi:hypothetical protein